MSQDILRMLAENGTSPSSLIWRFFLGATGGWKLWTIPNKITQAVPIHLILSKKFRLTEIHWASADQEPSPPALSQWRPLHYLPHWEATRKLDLGVACISGCKWFFSDPHRSIKTVAGSNILKHPETFLEEVIWGALLQSGHWFNAHRLKPEVKWPDLEDENPVK